MPRELVQCGTSSIAHAHYLRHLCSSFSTDNVEDLWVIVILIADCDTDDGGVAEERAGCSVPSNHTQDVAMGYTNTHSSKLTRNREHSGPGCICMHENTSPSQVEGQLRANNSQDK